MNTWIAQGPEGDLFAGYAEVMGYSTGHVLMHSVTIHAPERASGNGIAWLSACELADWKSPSGAMAAHAKAAAAMHGMGIFPVLGLAEADYDHLQVAAHKSHAHFGANYDKYYSRGGVQKAQQIMIGIASLQISQLV